MWGQLPYSELGNYLTEGGKKHPNVSQVFCEAALCHLGMGRNNYRYKLARPTRSWFRLTP